MWNSASFRGSMAAKALLLFCLVLPLGGLTFDARAESKAEVETDSRYSIPSLTRGEVRGVFAMRGTEAIAAEGEDQRLTPASVLKLVVSAAALRELGPEYRFRTAIYASSLSNGAAESLLVAAGGDPTWSKEFYDPDPALPLRRLAEQVRASGVRRVAGDLIVDTSAVIGRRVPNDWPGGDASLGYGAAPSALAWKDNRSKLRIAPGASVGMPAVLEAVDDIQWRNESTTVSAERDGRGSIEFDLDWDRNAATLRGEYPISERSFLLDVATPDPDSRAARALRNALADVGVVVEGSIVLRSGSQRTVGMTRVAELQSPPLREILIPLLADSNNFLAEMLLRHLGLQVKGEGRLDLGVDASVEFLEEVVGIASGSVEIDDGSGLSPFNLLTPRSVVSLLQWAWQQPWRQVYFEAMTSGRQGTVKEHWPKAPPLRGKTGTLRQTQCLAGVLLPSEMKSVPANESSASMGTPIFFAWMINHSTRSRRDIRREMIGTLWQWRNL